LSVTTSGKSQSSQVGQSAEREILYGPLVVPAEVSK